MVLGLLRGGLIVAQSHITREERGGAMRKRGIAILAVLALVLGWSGMASAAYIVDLAGRYSIGGGPTSNFTAPVIVQPDGSYTLATPDMTIASTAAGSIVLKNASGMVSLLDPVQTLVLGVTDSGAADEFIVALSVPLAPPITGLASVVLSLTGSCTDGTLPANGCGVSPGLAPGEAPNLSLFTVNGFANLVGKRGDAQSTAGPSTAWGFPSGTPTANWGDLGPFIFNCAAVGGCTTFDTTIDVFASGGGDSLGLTARFQIDAVPMPSSIMLLGVGLLGAAGITWRKRRA